MKTLTQLDPREYEHPLDQKALNALEKTAGLDRLIRKFYDLGIEQILKVQYTGSNIRATAANFPQLSGVLAQACATLYLPQIPDLYIQRGDDLEALVLGVENPIIVLSNTAVEKFSDAELRFVLGKAIGHIKSSHMLYHEIGWLLPIISDVLAAPTLGLSTLFSAPLQLALINWIRMSAYTSDRAGLLACQDIQIATQVLMKIAGMPLEKEATECLDEFIAQAREFEGFDGKMFKKTIKFVGAFFSEQSWTIARASQFFKWTESGAYEQILSRETQRKSTPIHFCSECGYSLKDVIKFCPECGTALSLPA